MQAFQAPDSPKPVRKTTSRRATNSLVLAGVAVLGLVVLAASGSLYAAEVGRPSDTRSGSGPSPEAAVRLKTGEPKDTPGKTAADGALTMFESRPVTALTVNIGHPKGEEPADVGRNQLARMQAEADQTLFARDWPKTCYLWTAPALAYRPLYFEEVNLERYGYGVKGLRVAQPLISAGQFFATVPTLPYRMVAEPYCEPVYTLGHYRPGSCVPYEPIVPPLSLPGGLAESWAAVGLVILIP